MKKGFTLIEMMAVIVILGLLSIIVIPNIAVKLKEKQNDVDEATKKIIYEASTLYLSDTISEIGDNSTFCVPLNDLLNKGYLTNQISENDNINLTHVVKVELVNGIYSYSIVSSNNCTASNRIYTTVSKLKSKSNSKCNIYTKQNCKDNKLNKIDSYNNPSSYPYALAYAYIGSVPSNLIVLGSNCFSIIGITNNNLLKIIYEGPSINNKCDILAKDNSNLTSKAWANSNKTVLFDSSLLKSDLENLVNDNNLTTSSTLGQLELNSSDKSKLEKVTFYIGTFTGSTLHDLLISEKNSTYQNYVGLINTSDFIIASSNQNCSIANTQNCNQNNYLANSNYIWSMNVQSISSNGITNMHSSNSFIVRPVMFLKSNIKLTGEGTTNSPYKIVDV